MADLAPILLLIFIITEITWKSVVARARCHFTCCLILKGMLISVVVGSAHRGHEFRHEIAAGTVHA